MALIHAEAEAVIEAEPAAIYAVISDYRRAHPHILPQEYFSNLVIEQGGDGAGTVFRVTVRLLGTERLFTPPIMRRIYRQELRQLAAYVQSTQSSAEDAPAEKP